jgi:large subunit ribosomal protein L29
MTKKEKINYQEFPPEELRQRLVETREKLFQMRFQAATAPLKNPHLISQSRKEIARILTFLNQKKDKKGDKA